MSTTDQSDVLDLINKMGTKDPKMQMLAQMMKQNQEGGNEQGADDQYKIKKLVSHIKKQAALIKKLEVSCRKMKKKINYLAENLNYRLEINDVLAGAVGACAECWGQDPQCSSCQGKGKPGSMAIDDESFANIVVPALQAHEMNNQALHRPKNQTKPN